MKKDGYNVIGITLKLYDDTKEISKSNVFKKKISVKNLKKVSKRGFVYSYDKETSFLLDTEMIKGLKETINLNPDTPAEELFDKAVQGIEFTGMGYAFNKLYPMIKAMRKVDVQKAATVTAGSLAAGEGAKKVSENIQNNIISEQTEKE